MVDKESVEILIDLLNDFLCGDSLILENVALESTYKRGLELLKLLAYTFPGKFHNECILQRLTDMLNGEKFVVPYVLKAFTYLGRYKPLIEGHIKLISVLAPICKKLIISGTPEQAKHAILCMYTNTKHSYCNELSSKLNLDIFPDVMEALQINLMPNNEFDRTAISSLGYIAYYMPDRFQIQIQKAIKWIVRDLIFDNSDTDTFQWNMEWCDEVNLPEKTRCKIAALKTIARWYSSSKQNESLEQKTFRLLSEIIKTPEQFLTSKSPVEMAWLRLTAGKAMLKIKRKSIGDEFIKKEFHTLSTLQ